MLEFDHVIVGSGMAGIAAALELCHRGIRPCIIDAGLEPKDETVVTENLYDYCEKNDAFNLLIGQNYSGLQNLRKGSKYLPARLTSPRFEFVTAGANNYTPVREHLFSSVQSLAQGGLGNAWGAGAYRFTQKDISNFPISVAELEPYYDKLTDEIGISGAVDDLTSYFGRGDSLQPPLRLSKNAEFVLKKYKENKNHLNSEGIIVGRPRMAVLTCGKQDRTELEYKNLEFWQPHIPAVYSPVFTLKRLLNENKIDYLQNLIVKNWTRKNHTLLVHSIPMGTGEPVTVKCNSLILAAGAINSSRIVLQSTGDYSTSLPLLDNPTLQIPLVLVQRLGRKLERDSTGFAQLISVFDFPEFSSPVQGSFFDLTSPARGEFFRKFPLSASGNLELIRYLLPSMLVLQIFFPSDIQQNGQLKLEENGTLDIRGSKNKIPDWVVRKILGALRKMGAHSAFPLVVKVPTGGGIHYGGSLPMKAKPTQKYECDKFGQLFGEQNVFVADGANLPSLPAKNYTFSIMANAMRIASQIT